MEVVRLHNIGGRILLGLLIITCIFHRGWSIEVTLAWDPPLVGVDESANNSLVGYNVYYGTNSGIYTSVNWVDATETTNTITGLTAGVTYYFTVTALNNLNLESGPAPELAWTAPGVVADTQPPTITAPQTMTVPASAAGPTPLLDLTSSATVTDDVSPESEISVVQVPAPGTLVSCGVTSVTLRASDLSGKTAEAVVTLIVVDESPPQITGVRSISLRADADGFVSVPDLFLGTTVTDNCSPSEAITLSQSPPPTEILGPVTDNVVEYQVTLSAIDELGNRTELGAILSVSPANVAPFVYSGEDTSINTSDGVLLLDGTVTDDGYPLEGELIILWRMVSGPVAVTFDDPTLLTSGVTFTEEGDYVLELSASDGALTSIDQMLVTVRLRGNPRAPKKLRIK